MTLTGSTVSNMEKHTEHADRLEAEADHLAEQSDALAADIADTREKLLAYAKAGLLKAPSGSSLPRLTGEGD